MNTSPPPSRILILTQAYVPDPSASGQLFHDVATALVVRGHEVCVLTANRGYTNPDQKYPSHERRNGVEIRRVPIGRLNRKNITVRFVTGLLFVIQAIFLYGIFSRGISGILVSTVSPLAPLPALILSWIQKIPLCYWIHDLNPDLAIKVGLISKRSFSAGILNRLNRRILSRSNRIIVLDEYMAKQIQAKQPSAGPIAIVPPWAPFDCNEEVKNDQNSWRKDHLSTDSRIVMYSGNHSLIHPLETLLQGARQLKDEKGLQFFFVGEGPSKRKIQEIVEREGIRNIKFLTFEPLSNLVNSLSAADVHVVSVGDATIGFSHPCKIYGAMAVGRPILLLGSESSPAARILNQHKIGWRVSHGDTQHMIETIKEIQFSSSERLVEMGKAAQEAARQHYSRNTLRCRLCDEIESVLTPPRL